MDPVIIDPDTGDETRFPNQEGALFIRRPWPGIARTVFDDHERYREIYFSRFPGMFFTGDGARRDEDGYYWITRRIDEVINVSGYRVGPAEVESALVTHPHVAEVAVVGFPHPIKGDGIYAFVALGAGACGSDTPQSRAWGTGETSHRVYCFSGRDPMGGSVAQDPKRKSAETAPSEDRGR